jgi:hypothetical protein
MGKPTPVVVVVALEAGLTRSTRMAVLVALVLLSSVIWAAALALVAQCHRAQVQR